MKNLKIPQYLQWIILTGVLFGLLMNVLRWVLVIWFRNPATENISLQEAYLLGARFDLRVVAVFMLLLFLACCIPPSFETWKRRILWGICLLFISTTSVFYAVDFGNYAYLHQRVNASILNYLDDAQISLGMLWQTYHIGWCLTALIAVTAALFIVIRFTHKQITAKNTTYTTSNHIIWGFLFLLAMTYLIVGRVVIKGGQFPLRWSDAFALGNDYAANISLNPFQSFFSTFSYRKSTYDEQKVREYYALMSEYLGIPENERDSLKLNFNRKVTGSADDSVSREIKNVVVVICESFSAYKSSMYGNPLNTTPYFNEMCKHGILFDRAFSPAYGTARGVWAIVTGIPDVNLGNTSSRNPAVVDQHSIINDFKTKEKYYFLGGSTSWANIRGLLTNNIQDLHLYEQGSYDAEEIDVWGISDKNLFLEANKVLRKESKPFFAIIQTADNHRPYTIPDEDLGAFKILSAPIDTLKKYGFESQEEYNAFRYTDFCFREFIDAARKEKYFDNTLFVFIGDHGIRGNATQILPKVFTEQGINNMHVPLLFYAPAVLPPAVYSTPASQVDVLPTIAHLCNIGYTNTTLGKNLFNIIRQPDNSVFLFDDVRKLIGTFNSNYYYNYQIDHTSISSFSSVTDNQKVSNDSIQKEMHYITNAFYETSKYLLLNNKKASAATYRQ